MLDEKIKQSIIKLAYFNPTVKDDYCNQVIDYLVLDSLANYGPLLQVTASQVKISIKDIFHLDFEDDEINASAKRLGLKGMIKYDEGTLDEKRKGEKPTFQILTETEEKIKTNISKIQDLEIEVIEEWKQDILNKYNDRFIKYIPKFRKTYSCKKCNRNFDHVVDMEVSLFRQFLS